MNLHKKLRLNQKLTQTSNLKQQVKIYLIVASALEHLQEFTVLEIAKIENTTLA